MQLTVIPRRAELDGHRPRDADDAVLGGGVRAGAGRRPEALGRSHVDDAAVSVAGQLGEAGPHQSDMGGEHDVEGTLPGRLVVFVGLLERGTDHDARVVDEDVDRAEGARDLAHHRANPDAGRPRRG